MLPSIHQSTDKMVRWSGICQCGLCCWHSFRLTRERWVIRSWLMCSPSEPLLFSRQRSPRGRVSFLARFDSAPSLPTFLLNLSDSAPSLFGILTFLIRNVRRFYSIIVSFGTWLTYPVMFVHFERLLNSYFHLVLLWDSFVSGDNVQKHRIKESID